MKQAIIDTLADADEPLTWDDLTAATGSDEKTLDTKIEELQADRIVRYSGRGGGYILHENYTRDRD